MRFYTTKFGPYTCSVLARTNTEALFAMTRNIMGRIVTDMDQEWSKVSPKYHEDISAMFESARKNLTWEDLPV